MPRELWKVVNIMILLINKKTREYTKFWKLLDKFKNLLTLHYIILIVILKNNWTK